MQTKAPPVDPKTYNAYRLETDIREPYRLVLSRRPLVPGALDAPTTCSFVLNDNCYLSCYSARIFN